MLKKGLIYVDLFFIISKYKPLRYKSANHTYAYTQKVIKYESNNKKKHTEKIKTCSQKKN